MEGLSIRQPVHGCREQSGHAWAGLIIGLLLVMTSCSGSPSFDVGFDRIGLGMNRSEVVGLLGPPDDQGAVFHLAQREGYEAEYERAKRSDAQTYLFWTRGVDVVYAIGLDSADRVVFKAVGGT